MCESVIELVQLTKRYGHFTAVDRLDLKIHKGEIFGLLGPNGAGKSTTILMMLGLTDPTSALFMFVVPTLRLIRSRSEKR